METALYIIKLFAAWLLFIALFGFAIWTFLAGHKKRQQEKIDRILHDKNEAKAKAKAKEIQKAVEDGFAGHSPFHGYMKTGYIDSGRYCLKRKEVL